MEGNWPGLTCDTAPSLYQRECKTNEECCDSWDPRRGREREREKVVVIHKDNYPYIKLIAMYGAN